MIGIAYEYQLGFTNTPDAPGAVKDKINGIGGLRTQINLLAISTNKLILNIGTTYWGSRVRTDAVGTGTLCITTRCILKD
jgi:hypothetical protein